MTPSQSPQVRESAVIALCWGTVMGASLETLVEAASRHGLGAVTLTARMYELSRAGGAAVREPVTDQALLDGNRGIAGDGE